MPLLPGRVNRAAAAGRAFVLIGPATTSSGRRAQAFARTPSVATVRSRASSQPAGHPGHETFAPTAQAQESLGAAVVKNRCRIDRARSRGLFWLRLVERPARESKCRGGR